MEAKQATTTKGWPEGEAGPRSTMVGGAVG